MSVQSPTHRSVLEGLHDPYFVQQVPVSSRLSELPRAQIFAAMLSGRRVLHVGYADWPLTDPQSNLHVQLDQVCAVLDGVDPHAECAEAIRPLVRGKLMRSLDEVCDSYDVVLVPEVIEHVGDLEGFLHALDRIQFETIVITAPDAYSCMRRHFDLVGDVSAETMVEVVHPDHNCWFTPYTLKNVVQKYTTWKVDEPLYFINRISLLLVASKA